MLPQNHISRPVTVLRKKADNAKFLAGHAGDMKSASLALGPETPGKRFAFSRAGCSHVLIGSRSIRPLNKIETIVLARREHFRQRAEGRTRLVEMPSGNFHCQNSHHQHQQHPQAIPMPAAIRLRRCGLTFGRGHSSMDRRRRVILPLRGRPTTPGSLPRRFPKYTRVSACRPALFQARCHRTKKKYRRTGRRGYRPRFFMAEIVPLGPKGMAL